MELKSLTLKDRSLFEGFLKSRDHCLCVYSFENIYIWKALFDISWQVIDECLCVFFRDKSGCFLYVPPLGRPVDKELLNKVFTVMDGFNKNREISRIENIEEEEVGLYNLLGYLSSEKFGEYLCERDALAELKGNKYKHKRALCNYFTKNYVFKYSAYSGEDRDGCLGLYKSWMAERILKHDEAVYKFMLKDSLSTLETALSNYDELRFKGNVVKIDGRIKGFTFGFELNKDIFCVLYEIADLEIKGLSQFIFREFCRGLSQYSYINIMDDSGLPNLKEAKLSYHPLRAVRSYIIKRRDA